ncbi:FUSC family protein [Georgenia daeguensis]|uniref:Integral membrane bound transporter domain-containing protein n=1 Tax=Georgenia daeguensis TaxID=908355 RepID=A0ABP8ETH5_9MICO
MREVLARLRRTLERHPLTRSVGAPTWALSALLAVGVGGTLLTGALTGRTDAAARAVLAMILVALPSIPVAPPAAARTLLVRTGTVALASVVVAALGGDPTAVAASVVVAAGLGFRVPAVGTTAALALLLLGVRSHMTSGPADVPAVWELAGAVVVALAALAVRLLPAGGRGVAAGSPDPAARPSWTVRRTAAVGVAVALAVLSPLGLYGGHWLVTAVLLSVRPTPAATRARVAQRLVGNTVAALLVAVLMGAGPSVATMGLVAGGLAFLAFALRPVNYVWWAVTAPPVLLIAGDFPQTHGWYEGMVRVGLNVVGVGVVMLVCYVPAPRSPATA